jgi:hypothetical protein
LLEVSRYLHLNPVRGVVLGHGRPMERRKRLREYRWSSYRGYAGLEKMKSFLDSELIQGVFESYSGRCWKAWEYRRWVEEGLIGLRLILNTASGANGGAGATGGMSFHW